MRLALLQRVCIPRQTRFLLGVFLVTRHLEVHHLHSCYRLRWHRHHSLCLFIPIVMRRLRIRCKSRHLLASSYRRYRRRMLFHPRNLNHRTRRPVYRRLQALSRTSLSRRSTHRTCQHLRTTWRTRVVLLRTRQPHPPPSAAMPYSVGIRMLSHRRNMRNLPRLLALPTTHREED